ncbi:peptidoglycan-binding protein [bacterium]|nr:peptidoglycan-binding protein [bacterium]
MFTYTTQVSRLESYIKKEIVLEAKLTRGKRGNAVRRVQEWLTFNGYGLVMDGAYGPITESVVARFQREHSLAVTGRVDRKTWEALVHAMKTVLQRNPDAGNNINSAVVNYAKQHLAEHPIELRADNCGPWVRLYMSGKEGPSQYWCAGFARFILRQATETLGIPMPVTGSVSCDRFAAQAKSAGLFLPESEARSRGVPPGSLFLVRKHSSDWTHIGIVIEATGSHIRTIEGNTNDDGERNGYEVCERTRSYRKKDFIRLTV